MDLWHYRGPPPTLHDVWYWTSLGRDSTNPNVNATGPDGSVVVGVDGSACSRVALRYAAREADMRAVKLQVVTVGYVDSPAGQSDADIDMSEMVMLMTAPAVVAAEDAGPPLQVSVPPEIERMVRAELAPWPALQVGLEAWEGRTSAVLVERSVGAAMVVVGARGWGGFAGLRLGSVAEQVLHLAWCPAVVVPPSHGAEGRDGPGGVVVGFDLRDGLSTRQRDKINFALYEAKLRKVHLEIAAVKFSLGRLRHPRGLPARDVHQTEESIAKVLQDEVDTQGVELTVKIHRGNVAGELAKVGQDVDLMVIGCGTGGLAPGTVRNQVVHYAPCPVGLYKQRASARNIGASDDAG